MNNFTENFIYIWKYVWVSWRSAMGSIPWASENHAYQKILKIRDIKWASVLLELQVMSIILKLRAWKKYKEKKEHLCKHAIHHSEKTCGLKYNLPIVCSHLHTTHCMQWNICPQISRCSRSLWLCWNIKYYTCLRATFKLHPSGVCMRVIVQPAQRDILRNAGGVWDSLTCSLYRFNSRCEVNIFQS